LLIRGHTEIVRSLKVFNGFLISCSLDSSVIKWDMISGELVEVFYPGDSVWSLLTWNNELFAALNFQSFSRFDAEDGSITGIVKGYSSIIWSVGVSENLLFAGQEDGFIVVWHTLKAEITLSFTGNNYFFILT
jgi:WD40 repeat protein